MATTFEPRAEVALLKPRQVEKLSPCQAHCPSGTDIRGWIALVAQREKLGLSADAAYARAWERLVEFNPLPAVLGRVCSHTCESRCNRAEKDAAVAIHHLERHIGDWAIARGLRLARVTAAKQPEHVGVIGSGPAGLSFAYQMARRGYAVTIYEQQPQAGGMLRYGIPEYRLPRAVLDAEIARILELGVTLHCGTTVGRDITAAQLQSRHAVVFAAIGAQLPVRLELPGDEGPGIWSGVEFMARVNSGEAVQAGPRVAVIGGGNTAIDAARAARRLGAEVTMIYRRTRQEMPAAPEEIEDALAEGITIQFLAAPVAVRRDSGVVVGLEIQRMEPGTPDASGRRQPAPVPGDVGFLPVDTVIAAVSQRPDWSALADLVDPRAGRPDAAGRLTETLWTGGDATGPGTVTRAIGEGRRAAEQLHARLRHIAPPANEARPHIDGRQMRLRHYASAARIHPASTSVTARLAAPAAEIEQPVTDHEFRAEAARCMSCGSCFGCGNCWMYCNPRSYARNQDRAPGAYFSYDPAHCEGCGKCVEICPCGFLSPIAS